MENRELPVPTCRASWRPSGTLSSLLAAAAPSLEGKEVLMISAVYWASLRTTLSVGEGWRIERVGTCDTHRMEDGESGNM